MNSIENQIARLIDFKQEKKFSANAWIERGLSPSDDHICDRLTKFFDEAADQLIDSLSNNASKKSLKRGLKLSLFKFNSDDYDTEEREFICDVFIRLASIIDVDFSSDLTRWLYGSVLSFLIKARRFLKPDKVVEVIIQSCAKCSLELKIEILEKDESIPELGWWIVRCNSCNEFNLLSPGAGVKESRHGHYRWIETLSLEEYTYEQALARFNQIKDFPK